MYIVDKIKSLYRLQEVVSGVTVGLLSVKRNKYRDISDYVCVSSSWALHAGKDKDGETQLTLKEKREIFISATLTEK
jgi:hypothetical protein